MIDFQRMTFLFATVISTLALRCEAANDFNAQASQKSISSSPQKATPSHQLHDDEDEDEDDEDEDEDDDDDDDDDGDEQDSEEKDRKNVVPQPKQTENKLLSDNGDKGIFHKIDFDQTFFDQTPSISAPSTPKIMKSTPAIQEEKQSQLTEPAPQPIDYSNQLNALAKELEEIKQLLNRQEATYRGLSHKSDTVDLHLGQIHAKLQQLADDQAKQQQSTAQQATQPPFQEPANTANAPQYFMDAPVIHGKPPVVRSGPKRRKVCMRPKKICCPPPATSQPAIIEMGRYTEDME